MFENTSEGIIVTDPEQRIVAVNPASTEITGYSEQEAIAVPPSTAAAVGQSRTRQCTLNSSFGSVQTRSGIKPAWAAKAWKPSTLYL